MASAAGSERLQARRRGAWARRSRRRTRSRRETSRERSDTTRRRRQRTADVSARHSLLFCQEECTGARRGDHRRFVPVRLKLRAPDVRQMSRSGQMKTELRQHVRYVTASDGTRLAWAESGDGPVVVKAANWLTHLEYEWESPVWRHWIQFFSAHCRFVRYDERGCGMSEWNGAPLTVDRWAADLESVIDAARPAGAGDAARHLTGRRRHASGTRFEHPERVARMILYGGYARGALLRDPPDGRPGVPSHGGPGAVGVGKRQPDLPPGLHVALHSRRQSRAAAVVQRSLPEDDLRRDRGHPAGGARRHGCFADHSRRCARRRSCCTRATTRSFRSRKGASSQPAFREPSSSSSTREITSCSSTSRRGSGFARRCSRFCGPEHTPAMVRCSPRCPARERQVLALIADGLSNTDIAERLNISEKTVRNHASNLFDKLGVWSRAQAIVFARDHGFSG